MANSRVASRQRLLTGVSALALALHAAPALATCTSVGSGATISSSTACVSWTGGNLSVTNIGTVTGTIGVSISGSNVSGTLTNSGSINGTSSYAVYNAGGTIGALANASGGTISGGSQGINNAGTIGTVTNQSGGTITGGTIIGRGVYNTNNITTLTNGGVIIGSTDVYNYNGSISTLTNTGTITGINYGIRNIAFGSHPGVIGTLVNTGTIQALNAIYNSSMLGPITNSGLIAGNITNAAAQALTIAGGSGTTIGTLTGHTGSIGSTNEGTITSTSIGGNLVFGSGNLLLNDAINVGTNTVTNSGATLSIVNTIDVTGTYAQSAGMLQVGSNGELSITGAASITGGTIGFGSSTGNYLAGTQTLVSASASSTYSGVTFGVLTGGLAATGGASGNDYVATITNDYVGASLNSISNTGVLSGAPTMVYVAGTGSLGSLGNSGTISGSAKGIYNNGGGITTLTNSGGINGASYGIENLGTIGTLTNSGNISSTNTGPTSRGIYNGGSIGVLTNASGGTISGLSAIYSVGTIGTLTNNGSIGGAVYNGGSITALTNTGTISSAISNSGGHIETLTNSNLISGATGIYNYAAGITSLVNSGTITGTSYGIKERSHLVTGGSIGSLVNIGTIQAPTAITISSYSTLGTLANSGLIVGNIVNAAAQDLTINGGSGSTIGTLTGYTTSSISTIGTITNTSSNLVFGSGNLLLNDTVNVTGHTVTNSGATLSIVNTIGVTGTYAQSSGALQVGSGGELSITGAASITGGTIGLASTGNYLAATSQTLVSASASSTYSGVTFGTPTGLAATGAASGNTYVASITNDYVGGSLSSISNTGVLSGAATMVYVAATGSLGSLSNSGTISGSAVGINNLGSIGAVTNTGTISGPTAVKNSGTLGPITNSGLIAGNVVNTAAQALTIAGASGTSFGTLTGASGGTGVADEGTITNTSANMVFSSGNVLLNDAINVGSHGVSISGATIQVVNPVSITGAWQQTGGGLVAQAASSASYGYLAVSGNATVANASIVIRGSGLAGGSTFTIVRSGAAGSYTGDSASVIGTSGLTATVQSIGNNLVVTLAGTSSSSGAGSGTFAAKGLAAGGVAAPLGSVLDAINGSSSPAAVAFQNAVLVPLSLLPASQQGQAMEQLAPVQNTFQVVDVGAATVLGAVEQHQQLAMAYNPSTGEAAGSDTLDSTLWAQMLGGGSERDTSDEAGGYRSSDYGLTAGADHLFTPDLLGGVAVSWLRAWTRGTASASGQSSTMDSYQLTFYGTYRMGRAFLDGQLGAGWNHFDQNRSISFLNQTASAGYDGQQYLASALAGYDIGVGGPGNMTVTPLAGLRWLRAHTDSYTENGAGAADLSVDGQTTDAVTQELGFRTAWSFQTGIGRLQPELKVEWLHDYTHGAIATSGIIGGQTFTTTTPRLAADGARIGIAATLAASDSLSFRAEYEGELRSGYQSHTGLIKALWQF